MHDVAGTRVFKEFTLDLEVEREHLAKRLAEIKSIECNLVDFVDWFCKNDTQLKSCVLFEELEDAIDKVSYVAQDIETELSKITSEIEAEDVPPNTELS